MDRAAINFTCVERAFLSNCYLEKEREREEEKEAAASTLLTTQRKVATAQKAGVAV